MGEPMEDNPEQGDTQPASNNALITSISRQRRIFTRRLPSYTPMPKKARITMTTSTIDSPSYPQEPTCNLTGTSQIRPNVNVHIKL